MLLAGAFFVSLSIAAIPAGYIGRPYPPGSAPHEIPGRVNFHDYDYVPPSLGSSQGVTFVQDDLSGSAGSNAGGRDGHIPGIAPDSDKTWPAFWFTNDNIYDLDTFYAAGVSWPNGVRYPDPVDTSVADCYIGASHANSMTKFTIHVPTAGKYWISSIWTEDAPPMTFHINFMNGANTVSTSTITLNPPEASYHAWRQYSDFASIQLDSGVQVMQFQNGSNHLNQDFLFIAADSGQFTTAILHSPSRSAVAGPLNISLAQKTVRFSVPDAGMTTLTVFDCLGKEVSQIMNRTLAAGQHTVSVNTANLKQGVYFLRISHNGTAGVVKFENFK
jgi:hypothetical protein